jgi:hypothetical protein
MKKLLYITLMAFLLSLVWITAKTQVNTQTNPQPVQQVNPQTHPSISPQNNPQMIPPTNPQMHPQNNPQMNPQNNPQTKPQTTQPAGKTKKDIDVKGVKIEKSKKSDPNIKVGKPISDEPVPNPNQPPAALTPPGAKLNVHPPVPNAPAPGQQKHGCHFMINNSTGFAMDIYIDGIWIKTINVWSNENIFNLTTNDKVTVYAKSCGGTISWGPSTINCDNQFIYNWRLTY